MTHTDYHICYEDATERELEPFVDPLATKPAKWTVVGFLTLACLCGGAVVIKGLWGWYKVVGQ